MKQSSLFQRGLSLLLSASLLLSLASCGGGAKATSMHLTRTDGKVSVSDDGGGDVPLLENLGLYSGYGVDTSSESYAWINLDDVKLTKMDQDSEIAIQKDGKALEIEVKSGSLFFNVTEPLKSDETMNIRTSTMLVGIRGTCGWVEDNDGLSRVYLLEGKVECSAGEQTVQVNAGEMAELTADGELTVTVFNTWNIPVFVQDEVEEDEKLAADVRETLKAADEQVGAEVGSGEVGEGVIWTLRGNTLFIRGTGEIRAPVVVDNHVDPTSYPWYGYREQIHTVIIGSGITIVGTMAFYECSNLTSVTIPNSVVEIRNTTFGACSSLTSIFIPSSVTAIGVSTFSGTGLTDIYYGGSESQWGQIENRDVAVVNATIHYNSTRN